ncbi:unnamed protein product, partial [Cunninghamella blakesleeana]
MDNIDNALHIINPLYVGTHRFYTRTELGYAFGASGPVIDEELPAPTRLDSIPDLCPYDPEISIGSFDGCLSCWESNGLNN